MIWLGPEIMFFNFTNSQRFRILILYIMKIFYNLIPSRRWLELRWTFSDNISSSFGVNDTFILNIGSLSYASNIHCPNTIIFCGFANDTCNFTLVTFCSLRESIWLWSSFFVLNSIFSDYLNFNINLIIIINLLLFFWWLLINLFLL